LRRLQGSSGSIEPRFKIAYLAGPEQRNDALMLSICCPVFQFPKEFGATSRN
jgi:hypothetical protein